MSPNIHDISALKLKLGRTNGKPASFLVGAPFSWNAGLGVPPVNGFIELIRERVAIEGPKFSEELEARLSGEDAAEQYQAAMSFVFSVLDADVVTEIVQNAVLSARKAGAPNLDPRSGSDGDPAEWSITQGQRGLAHLIKLDSNRFSGPVFTTNFDPMMGLALKSQGIRYQPYTIPQEGSLNAPISVAQDDVNIFHLHGYWRDSPTLHSPQQLEAKRAQLQASLEKHLHQTNLVVMAYSGWDDIFTSALANCLSSDTFSGTVTWCFYNGSPAEIREQNAALFAKFKGGVQQERITFFHGINCHTFFDELIADLGFDSATRSAIETSPLAGWEVVSKERLDAFDPLTGEEAVRFFDGAVPTLRHAISPLIPRLSHSATLVDRVDQGLSNTAGCTMQLVRSAGGEGKSTVLLQAAVAAARERDCVVLHRPSPDAGLNPDVVASLDPAHHWLLVADEAEGFIDDLWQCAVRLHEAGRHNVTFLLAARDTDWLKENGDQKGWSGRLNRLGDLVLGGIEQGDAELVVDAWSEQGDAGLRSLMAANSRDERIKKLIAATKAQDVKGGDGSFFGGLLETRFSGPALVDHVVALIEPLRHREIDGGSGTLYDALLYIANCHAVGMPGIDKHVLAAICDLHVGQLSSGVTAMLGQEMGAGQSRGHILSRHKRVAQSVLTAAENRLGTDIGEYWARLIRATVEVGHSHRFEPAFHTGVMNGSAKLTRTLPSEIPKTRRDEISLSAAEAAVAAQPERMDVVCDLAAALRQAGYREEAFNLLKDMVPEIPKKVDSARNIRGFFFEWAACAGNLRTRQGFAENAWLAAFSLCDTPKTTVTADNRHKALAGMCDALAALAIGGPGGDFAKGRRAAATLGYDPVNDPGGKSDFEYFAKELDRLGVPEPAGPDEALSWLARVSSALSDEIGDPTIKRFAQAGPLTFNLLRDSLPSDPRS
ncbi:SIR2 family protein [uncultured Roseobacter sp.]|uniref:P-loop NTPase n=1 Tax=uncultured Roseobacter sp. TaxID=114847 RepID=UPI00262077D1|nr:SIR2 family protein [uncultured Roseobacter sp.]